MRRLYSWVRFRGANEWGYTRHIPNDPYSLTPKEELDIQEAEHHSARRQAERSWINCRDTAIAIVCVLVGVPALLIHLSSNPESAAGSRGQEETPVASIQKIDVATTITVKEGLYKARLWSDAQGIDLVVAPPVGNQSEFKRTGREWTQTRGPKLPVGVLNRAIAWADGQLPGPTEVIGSVIRLRNDLYCIQIRPVEWNGFRARPFPPAFLSAKI